MRVPSGRTISSRYRLCSRSVVSSRLPQPSKARWYESPAFVSRSQPPLPGRFARTRTDSRIVTLSLTATFTSRFSDRHCGQGCRSGGGRSGDSSSRRWQSPQQTSIDGGASSLGSALGRLAMTWILSSRSCRRHTVQTSCDSPGKSSLTVWLSCSLQSVHSHLANAVQDYSCWQAAYPGS